MRILYIIIFVGRSMFTAGYYDFLRNLIGLKPLTPGSTPADIGRRQSKQ